MAATGIHDFTLAFVLAGRGCSPEWDGTRPLLGGSDAASIAAIRAAGGDVSVSFGGWSGRKLGTRLPDARRAGRRLREGHRRLRPAGHRHRHRAHRVLRRGHAAAGRDRPAPACRWHDPSVEITITFGCDAHRARRRRPQPHRRRRLGRAPALRLDDHALRLRDARVGHGGDQRGGGRGPARRPHGRLRRELGHRLRPHGDLVDERTDRRDGRDGQPGGLPDHPRLRRGRPPGPA